METLYKKQKNLFLTHKQLDDLAKLETHYGMKASELISILISDELKRVRGRLHDKRNRPEIL